jgi:hypothetical protein
LIKLSVKRDLLGGDVSLKNTLRQGIHFLYGRQQKDRKYFSGGIIFEDFPQEKLKMYDTRKWVDGSFVISPHPVFRIRVFRDQVCSAGLKKIAKNAESFRIAGLPGSISG